MMLMEVPDRWSDVLLDGQCRLAGSATSLCRRSISTLLDLRQRPHRAGERLLAALSTALPTPNNTITGDPNTAERDPRQPRRRVPVHGHHERLRRRRSRARCSPRAASATPTATARPSSSTAGAIRSSSSAGRPASIRTSSSTPMSWTIATDSGRQPGPTPAAAITIRSTCIAHDRLAFRLVPLIYSPGRDEEVRICQRRQIIVTWRTSALPARTSRRLALSRRPDSVRHWMPNVSGAISRHRRRLENRHRQHPQPFDQHKIA